MKLTEVEVGAGFIFASLAAGFLGSLFSMEAIPGWYKGLRKPSWTPPNKVFGPVWTTLYVLMGIAATVFWFNADPSKRNLGLLCFGVQLVLNYLWSYLFFGAKRILFALIEMALLWASIAITAFLFYQSSHLAGLMLAPYLAWVSYAATLNWGIYKLNHTNQSI